MKDLPELPCAKCKGTGRAKMTYPYRLVLEAMAKGPASSLEIERRIRDQLEATGSSLVRPRPETIHRILDELAAAGRARRVEHDDDPDAWEPDSWELLKT